MASRGFSKALRAASKQKLPSQSFQRRSLASLLGARPATAIVPRATFAGKIQQQVRGLKTIDFAGHKEQVFGQSALLDYVVAILTNIRARRLAAREAPG
jgi:ketol-acid reductoisomerase